LLGWVCLGCVSAQSYPNGPVRIVVGFAAGGAADATARLIAPKLHQLWGQPVIVENRAGANGILAAEFVAKSSADGYTLLVPTNGMFTINPGLYKKLPYDSIRDFASISRINVIPNVLAVHPSLPVKSVRDLIRVAKSRPGDLTFGSGGVGGVPHLSGVLFNSLAGTKITHVPYKGGGPSTIGLLSGEVAMTFNTLITSLPHIRTGKLRALAVTTDRRAPSLPDIPTIAESGVPGYESSTWYGLAAPAKAPQAVTDIISRSLENVLAMSDIEKSFNALGADPAFDKPKAFVELIKSDTAKWAKVVEEAGIRSE
jgi:tripartite-type tricarboxylate transporter receptor subunit TctC